MAEDGQPKKRTFRKYSYRGIDLDKLLDYSNQDLMELFRSRMRRKFSRGIKRKPIALLKKLRKAKRETAYGDKPELVKTHLRNMCIVPEMIGSMVGVYNGKQYINVEVKPEMLGHYLAEFSITYKPIRHSSRGGGKFAPLRLAELKTAASSIGCGKVTNNEALSAAVTLALAKSPAFAKSATLKRGAVSSVGMITNSQGKGHFKHAKHVVGNFSQPCYLPTAKPPDQMSMADAVAHFRAVGDTWRDPEKSAAIVRAFTGWNRFMDLARKFPVAGPFANMPDAFPLFFINNQMVYPSAQIRFGKAHLLGYTPWHSIDQVHFVAASEPPSAYPGGAKPAIARQQSAIKRVVGALDVRAAFNLADADHSGAVSKAELAAALKAQAHLEVEPAELDEIFSLMDTNESGEVDGRQFEAAFYAARLAGGVDVYIPVTNGGPKQVAALESADFKHTLLHGWRQADGVDGSAVQKPSLLASLL